MCELYAAIGKTAQVLYGFADGTISHTMRDIMNAFCATVLADESKKTLEMRGRPSDVRLILDVVCHSIIRRPTIEYRCANKVQIESHLASSSGGIFERNIVTVNKDECVP